MRDAALGGTMAAVKPAEEPAPVQGPPKLNVLVVEDDESMLHLVRLHLGGAGYVVTVARDIIEAGIQILKRPPDAIVLDVDLPYMNGLEFARTLLADRSLPWIPIIFITAHEHFAEEAQAIGAACLMKPFYKEKLLECVRGCLSAR